jgi:uncharacterized protein YbjT (DUF2867 family)
MGVYSVTLAAGQQGRATIAELLKGGHRVHAMVRDRNSTLVTELGQIYPQIDIFEAPFEDPSRLRTAITGTEGIFIN